MLALIPDLSQPAGWLRLVLGVGMLLVAYNLFPWLVIDKLTVWHAASSTEALMVIFYGVVIVLPVIIGYTVFAYRVFWGKSTALNY